MAPLQPGDSFPEGVTFSYIHPTGSLDLTSCGIPTTYDASKEFQNKKIVLVAVPGAFTPTCQEQHITSYLSHLDQLKAKGVDGVIFIASNDAFVMSAWGKANGIKDESILFASDANADFSRSIGWASADRTGRYALVIDHGKVVYAEADTVRGSIANSGAEGVLAKL
ncbi:Redoxin [Dichotomopilus funicola]|uniref:Thioredoxin peroxidase n=1 Tax=Dichotomopilus funicola TaxID=1934379 RepID=A0AAN6ZJ05_9PEZI|nr:Redoxin [Dichotomopilus funicola]